MVFILIIIRKITERKMKRIVVEMTYDVDIIEVPDEVEKNLKRSIITCLIQ